MSIRIIVVCVCVCLVAVSSSPAAEIGTAFTYQGFLEKPAGVPVDDTCNFQFSLWKDATSTDPADQTGPTLTFEGLDAVAVVAGIFGVTLDFGPGAIDGAARWLAIEVQCTDDPAFFLLSPRIELKPTPYSLRAAEGVGPPNSIEVDSTTGAVGIGTTDPACKLHVAGGDVCIEGGGYNFVPPGDSEAELAFYRGGTGIGIFRRFAPDHTIFQVWAPPQSQGINEATLALVRGDEPNVEYVDVYNNGYPSETQYGIRMQKRGTGEFRDFVFDYSDGVSPKSEVMRLTPSGNVGIGTATPAARFDVNGPARATTMEITGGLWLALPVPGWGLNDLGQADVPAGAMVAVAAGDAHSLAIRNDSTLAGWGSNAYGETNVPFGTFVAVAAGGLHGLAIRSDGTLAGWGYNGEGQVNVPSGTFSVVAAGERHSLAIRTDGTLAGWGQNYSGEINVPSGTFIAVAAGYAHSLAIRSDGSLVGWGANFSGQINLPSGTFAAVAAGTAHSLGIRSDGTLVGWGDNAYGQINVPTGSFIAVAAGGYHSLAIRSDGTLVGWGWNNYGQAVVPSGGFVAVSAGRFHSLAIRDTLVPAAFGLRLATDSAAKPGSNTWTIFSDRRLKKNIEPLSGALERVLQLHGVTFQWADPASQGGITGIQMGLIADEVQRVFPQWVGRDPKGYQTLTVGGFEALTAEAFRELRAEKDREIEDLKSQISDLQELVKSLAEKNGNGR